MAGVSNNRYQDIPTTGPALHITRLPETKAELWHWYATVLGIKFPTVQVCPDHIAPFDLVWAIYKRYFPVVVVKGSRGFSGKSWLLGSASIGTAILQGIHVNVLGGSAAQSLNVHEISQDIWYRNYAPRNLLAKDPTRYETLLTNGGRIRALMASTRSVRGPHPNILCVDELDEIEDPFLLDSALGQAMTQTSGTTGQEMVPMNVLISTHHYPDGLMSEVWERAEEKGCKETNIHQPDPVRWLRATWCWRESLRRPGNPGGWLSPDMVESKRATVSPTMWQVEYENNDPSAVDGIIDPESVAAMWDEELGWFKGAPDEHIEMEPPRYNTDYVIGIDWAKKRDWTIISVWRPTEDYWWLAYWVRLGRKPWPEMVQVAVDLMKRYPGILCHDATGVGDVLGDLFPDEAREHGYIHGEIMRGEPRSQMFSDYIRAIEQRRFKAPRIQYAFEEHLYCRYEDLYATTGHPPDSIVSGSMAWLMRDRTNHYDFDFGTLGPRQERSAWTMSPTSGGITLSSSGWNI